MYLKEILSHKKEEIKKKKRSRPASSLTPPERTAGNRFSRAVSAPGISLIAEIKRASPSRGLFAPELAAAKTAVLYERNGAAALSVLTDEKFFQGGLCDLQAARAAVGLPILAKDFFIDPYQVQEAAWAGADAVLLIMAVLSRAQAAELAACARETGLEILAEVHEEKEVEKALETAPDLLGINNRNLKTFTTSLAVTFRVYPLVPGNYPVISESGIKNREDLQVLSELGINGFLVGEALAGRENPGAALRALLEETP